MSTLTPHHGLSVLTPTPTPGAGGNAINENFKALVEWSPKSNWGSSTDPTTGDDIGDDYYPGSYWYNSIAKRLFLCIDNSASAAVWHPLIPATGGKVIADTSGNTRGVNAVDLQLARSANTQVASGSYAFVGGGQQNTSSGNHSFGGGFSSTASGQSAIAYGNSAIASGSNSQSFGSTNTASTTYAMATGRSAVASRLGEFARATGAFSAPGDAQASCLIARRDTSTASATELFLDGSGERITIPTNTTVGFTAWVAGRRKAAAGNGDSAFYRLEGLIRNNGGTTALVGTVGKTVIAENVAAWDANAIADNTNDALVIQVTGDTSGNIYWVAMVQIVQITST